MQSVIPSEWEVPQLIRDRLGESAGRQRAMVADGHVLLILHEPPGDELREREGVLFWRDPTGNWQTTAAGSGLDELRAHWDRYESLLDQLEATADQTKSSAEYFEVLKHLQPLERAVRNGALAMQVAREVARKDKAVISLRDQAHEIHRHADLLQAEVRNALGYAMARQAERQAEVNLQLSRSGHQINLLAALFLPVTALASLFGMNLSCGLESDSPWLFWGVLVSGLCIGFLLRSLLGFKRRD